MHLKLFTTLLVAMLLFNDCGKSAVTNQQKVSVAHKKDTTAFIKKSSSDTLVLDTVLYNNLLLYLSHNKPNSKWPVKTAYPLPGAILPFKRIVTYYGNFYSKGMGILGELPPDGLLQKLQSEGKKW